MPRITYLLTIEFKTEQALQDFFANTAKPALEEEDQRIYTIDEVPIEEKDARVFHVHRAGRVRQHRGTEATGRRIPPDRSTS